MRISSLNALCAAVGFSVAALAALAPAAHGAPLVVYSFGVPGQETTDENSPVFDPTAFAAGTTASRITDPNGVVGLEASSAATTPANAPFLRLDPQGNSADPNAADANNKYFQFTLSALPGQDVDLTNLTFTVHRGGAATPRGIFVRTSADNFASVLPLVGNPALTPNATNPNGSDVNTARPAQTAVTADLSGAAFQNIQNLGSGLTLRFYSYSPGAGSSLDYDDITINGTVAPIPEPASLGLLAVAGLLVLRRRPA
jgi:hypothetical protein